MFKIISAALGRCDEFCLSLEQSEVSSQAADIVQCIRDSYEVACYFPLSVSSQTDL